jgi:hypothetical protein
MDDIYGFSLSTPDKLSRMDKILLNMPIKLVFGDSYSYFVKEHPVLKYIKKYYDDKVETKLSDHSQLNELLRLYSQEPSKKLIELEINKRTSPYIEMMKDIEENCTVFYKADNITKISFKLFGFNQKTTQEIHNNFNKWDKMKNIILCPYCAHIFTSGKGYEILDKISPRQTDNTQQRTKYKPKMIYDPKPLCEYFGVTWPDPNMDLLKTNYHKMLSEYHPDKVNNLGIELRSLAEEKTKEITTNYGRLENIISNTNANM